MLRRYSLADATTDIGLFPGKERPLVEILCPHTLADAASTRTRSQGVPAYYRRAVANYEEAWSRLRNFVENYELLPSSHRRPSNTVYTVASPWREVTPPQRAAVSQKGDQARKPSAITAPAIPNLTANEWQIYLRYIKHYWRPYWPWGVASAGLMMGMGIYGAVYAATLKGVLDTILVAGGGATVVPTLIGLIGGLPVAFGMTVAGTWLASRISARIANDLRYDLLAHLQSHSVAYYKENKLGDLLSHFAGDLLDVERGMTRVLLRIVTGAITVGTLMLLLFWFEWHLALYVLVVLPLVTYFLQKAARYVTSALRAQRNSDGSTISNVEETLRAQPLIQSFGIRKLIQDSYWAELQKLEKASAKSGLGLGFLVRSSDAGTILVDVSTVSLGVILISMGITSVTTLVAFQALSITLRREFTTAVNDSQLALQSVASIGRIDRLFQQSPLIFDTEDAVELPTFRNELRFEDVSSILSCISN